MAGKESDFDFAMWRGDENCPDCGRPYRAHRVHACVPPHQCRCGHSQISHHPGDGKCAFCACGEYHEIEQLRLPFPPTTATDDAPSDPTSPAHYRLDGMVEAIDLIETALGDGFRDYCLGNALKYLLRFRKKDGLTDLRKARVYLGWLIEAYERDAK